MVCLVRRCSAERRAAFVAVAACDASGRAGSYRETLNSSQTNKRRTTMKFVCLAYGDRKKMEALTKEQFEAMAAQCKVHDAELRATGKLVSGTSLEWDARTIRPKNGT